MDNKIALLMEETGCDFAEAQLALEMGGWQVEEALKALACILKNIVVVKARFIHPQGDRFGLLLAVLNAKSGEVLRARAVLSYNPAVYESSLDKHWFEFEKSLYSCRLWEGSLPAESLELEHVVARYFREGGVETAARLARASEVEVHGEVVRLLHDYFGARTQRVRLVREVLDLGQFHAAARQPDSLRQRVPAVPAAEESLVLKLELERDPAGLFAADLRCGDMIAARITDPRDVAQYLAKLFGGYGERGPVPVLVPVEAVEAGDVEVLVRARFSTGVCGDGLVRRDERVKAVRIAVRNQDKHSWWRRIFNAR